MISNSDLSVRRSPLESLFSKNRVVNNNFLDRRINNCVSNINDNEESPMHRRHSLRYFRKDQELKTAN